jgi:hypothetical protein
MRQRTTWKQDTHRNAATLRKADPYTMNQNHPQPTADQYMNGSPSEWAEDVNTNSSVALEYENGHVKRNEINMAEFRDDTFTGAGSGPWGKGGKYDNARLSSEQMNAAHQKAQACQRIASSLLKTDNKEMIEKTAIDLMGLPIKSIASTIKRLDQLSPAALPDQARFRRALACTKLSAILLTEDAEEEGVKKLALVFNGLDDMTLKNILHIVALHRVAETAPAVVPEIKVAAEAEKKDEKEPEKKIVEKKEDEPKDGEIMKLLEDLAEDVQEIKEEVVEGAKTEGGEEGKEDIEALFAEGAEGGEGDKGPEIGFEDGENEEEEKETQAPKMSSDLTGLFDTDENIAQRELSGQNSFQKRTASEVKGVKKLGQVKVEHAPRASIDNQLEALWERPE